MILGKFFDMMVFILAEALSSSNDPGNEEVLLRQ